MGGGIIMERKRTNIPTSYYYGCRADLFAKEAEKADRLGFPDTARDMYEKEKEYRGLAQQLEVSIYGVTRS